MREKTPRARKEIEAGTATVIGVEAPARAFRLATRVVRWRRASGFIPAALILSAAASLFSWRRWRALERRLRTHRLSESESVRTAAEFRLAVRMLPHALFKYERGADGGIYLVYMEGAIAEEVGLTTRSVGGREVEEIYPPEMLETILPAYRRAFEGQSVEFHSRLGERVYETVVRLVVDGAEGAPHAVRQIVGFTTDVTERTRWEGQLAHRAFHDPLTELPNRALFMDRLEHALERRRRTGRATAVLFLDLDDLKAVNDGHGHEAGDMLLVSVADRLRSALRTQDTLARLGGDEFAVLAEEVEGEEGAVQVAERLLERLRAPIRLGSADLVVTASIGVALSAPGASRPPDLLRAADAAMYAAKSAGKAGYRVFEGDAGDTGS